jgi:hypothetical protein
MRKFYATLFTILSIFPLTGFGKPGHDDKKRDERKGFVKFNLDNAKNDNRPVEAAYVILDKYNLTGAGYINQRFEVTGNKIEIYDLPEGKYYADIYTAGLYRQHFSKVIYVSKKGSVYTFKIEETRLYVPNQAIIPAESNDLSKTTIVRMK